MSIIPATEPPEGALPGGDGYWFTPLPVYLLEAVFNTASPINAPAAMLWAHIHRNYAWRRRVFPSYAKLAEETGQSESAVKRQLTALKAADALRIGKLGTGGRNVCVLALRAPFDAAQRHVVSADGWAYAISGRPMIRIKIGHSRDPRQRLMDLQSGSAEPLQIIWQAKGGAALERLLHDHFAEQRLHGEWFDFTGQDAAALIAKAAASFQSEEANQ